MRTFAVILSLAGVVACASGGGTPGTAPTVETARVTSGSQIGLDRISVQDRRVAVANAPVADVWKLMSPVLDSLGIKVATMNGTSYDIGNTGMDVRQRLGSVIVNRYFDCPAGGAMSLELSVSIMVHLDPITPTTTNIVTKVDVRGKPMSYSGDWVNCSSTGVLEQRIADAVNSRLRH